VKDERQSLGRREGVEYDQERETDRVRQKRLLLGLERVLGADDGIGQVHAAGLLATYVAGAQHVETDAGDDRRQPAAEVLDTFDS
jgi:hypothetical protein